MAMARGGWQSDGGWRGEGGELADVELGDEPQNGSVAGQSGHGFFCLYGLQNGRLVPLVEIGEIAHRCHAKLQVTPKRDLIEMPQSAPLLLGKIRHSDIEMHSLLQ